MPLSEGWRDQYERMLRSRDKLIEAAGPSSIGSDEARDRLYHFFQDAFHLRDWLYNSNDQAVKATAAVLKNQPNGTGFINTTPALALCGDVCHGIKHLKLKTTFTGDKATTIATQSVAVTPPTISVGVSVGGAPSRPRPPAPPATAVHEWTITSGGQQCDAVDLADQVIAAWDAWLKAHGLL